MKMISARDIANMSLEEVWALPDSRMTLNFDDGAIETNNRATIFSWYFWEYIRKYPKTPILKRHHINQESLGSGTALKLVGAVLFDCFDAYEGKLDIEHLNKMAYEITNVLVNHLTIRLEAYVTSSSIIDFVDIVNHPVIKAANDSVQPTEKSITDTYATIRQVLLDPNELPKNNIANAAKSGLIKMGQVQQCVGPVGFRTDVDSNIFRYPILKSFTHGLTDLYSLMIESRSATKALMFAKDPLRTAEYFNRKLQLACATLQRVNYHDCGSTDYMSMKIHAADLQAFAGKYYKTDQGLAVLKRTDRHLVGKTLQLRTLRYCRDTDPAGVCSTCFGDLALSIPRKTNLGHVCATALCEETSQRILSTKHLDGSSAVDDIILTDYDKRYIRSAENESAIYLAARLKGRTVKMVIASSEASGLADISYTDNVKTLQIQNLTSLTEVSISISSGGGNDTGVVPVSLGNRRGSLSHQALDFLKRNGWSLTTTGDYEIDLTHWDNDQPLFILPMKHLSVVDYVKTIEAKLIGQGGRTRGHIDLRPLSAFEDYDEALMSVYNLVSSKLSVNFAHLEGIVFSLSIRSSDKLNYHLPLPDDAHEFGRFKETMKLRSLSALLAYEGQRAALYDPVSYLVEDRPSHILDYLVS